MIYSAAANLLCCQPALLAARNLRFVSQRSSASGSQIVVHLGIACGVIAAVCLGAYLVSWVVHQRRYNSHASLFAGLCKVHALDRSARKLLIDVARHRRLRRLARMFTDPRWLDPASLRGSMRRKAAHVDALRRRLFS